MDKNKADSNRGKVIGTDGHGQVQGQRDRDIGTGTNLGLTNSTTTWLKLSRL